MCAIQQKTNAITTKYHMSNGHVWFVYLHYNPSNNVEISQQNLVVNTYVDVYTFLQRVQLGN